MNLLEIKINKEYIIERIDTEEKIKRRLLTLGVMPGSKIKVLNKKINDDLIIKIRGTRLGICKEIAKYIFIREEINITKDEK